MTRPGAFLAADGAVAPSDGHAASLVRLSPGLRLDAEAVASDRELELRVEALKAALNASASTSVTTLSDAPVGAT